MIAWSILLGAVAVLAMVSAAVLGRVAIEVYGLAREREAVAASLRAHEASLAATRVRERDAAGDLDRLCKRLDALEASERLQAIEHQIETLALKVELGG